MIFNLDFEDYYKYTKSILKFLFGWIFWKKCEQKHLDQLEIDEQHFSKITVSTHKFQTSDQKGQLVVSNIALSIDYFRSSLAQIPEFLGQPLDSYEIVADRARREVLIRLKKQAASLGYDEILGLRFETSSITANGQMLEVIAYGTAIKKNKN
ncbi:YbjQ family protein [Acinetobacter gerneri]|uniref:YbjQ family protein n=1 Tax=Acinetobacter gerneri TaxID=202952 RepID=UPI0028A8E1C3|nr:heavy metal-binding domain-containing protein [Acinetobacter gerneri]